MCLPIMAVAAFKSTSKRTSIGAQDSSGTATTKGKSDPSCQNGLCRKTRNLNDYSENLYRSTSSEESSLSSQTDFGTRRDNPLFRGSTVLEEATTHLQQNKEDSQRRRGRSLSRTPSHTVNNTQSQLGHGQRRGRSVSRHPTTYSQNTSNQKAHIDSGRRGRSLSRCKYNASESDMDPASRMGQGRLKTLGVVDSQRKAPNKPAGDQSFHQQGLRRCSSQQNISQSLDGYSTSMHPDEYVEEKTIKSVYEQIKSFRSDHPTGDINASGLHGVIRSEVQRAVAEIKFDLEQAIARKNSSSTADGYVREEYVAQLEQSEKRARDLLAQFTVEEQRCLELSRIVKDLHPDPSLSETQKPSRTRKRSVERRKMSKSLTEEAQTYFDEFVSISTMEDSEMSSLEEFENGLFADGTFYTEKSPVPPENDVVLPWLKSEIDSDANEIQHEVAKSDRAAHTTSNKSSSGSCSTNTNSRNPRNISNLSPESIKSKTPLPTRSFTDRTNKHEAENYMDSFVDASQEDCMKTLFVESGSSYQSDDYLLLAHNEAVLIDNLKAKNIVDFGGLLLCNKLCV